MSSQRRGPHRAGLESGLRAEILRISRELLDEGGPALLSMREVARRAGCTHQAPYHYFEDREAILAVLVGEGFDQLSAKLKSANELAPSHGVRAALLASARAYVDFALSQPGVFRVMFRPDMCNPQRFPTIVEAGRRARGELDGLNEIVHGADASPAHASILWAHVHGLACLQIDGPGNIATGTDTADVMPSQLRRELDEVAERFADMVLCERAGSRSKRLAPQGP